MNRSILRLLLISVFPCYPIASPPEEFVQLPACLESNNISTIIDRYHDDICKRVTSAIEQCDSDVALKQSAQDGNVVAMFALSKCYLDHNFVLPAYEWFVRSIIVLKRDFACFKQVEQSNEIFEVIAGRLIDSFNKKLNNKKVAETDDIEKQTRNVFKNAKELPANLSWLKSHYLTLRDETEWPEVRAAALEEFRQEYNNCIDNLN